MENNYAQKHTILIADDDMNSRRQLSELLAPHYTLLFAENSEAALALL